MCQRPSNGKIPNQQDLVLKHQTLRLAPKLLLVPATGLDASHIWCLLSM